MKILVLLTLIFSTFSTVFAEGHNKYKEEDFDKIKLSKTKIFISLLIIQPILDCSSNNIKLNHLVVLEFILLVTC